MIKRNKVIDSKKQVKFLEDVLKLIKERIKDKKKPYMSSDVKTTGLVQNPATLSPSVWSEHDNLGGLQIFIHIDCPNTRKPSWEE